VPAGYAAILLTGGRSARMGVAGKPGLAVGGRSLAARVAAAVPDAARVIVVGQPYGVAAAEVLTEDPPGGGPVAAIAAGLPRVPEVYVAVLAGDLPFLDAATVAELLAAAVTLPADVALLVDDGGRDQLLCAVWRTAALAAALAALPTVAGASMRALLGVVLDSSGTIARRTVSRAAGPPPWFDCDTPVDLAEARRWT
jgi:molybdopterin-guanine dinucleotide biosynthesis protein A